MTTAPGGDGTADDPPEPPPEDGQREVLLCVSPGRDRDLLAEALEHEYEVRTGECPAALESTFDLCIVDAAFFEQHRSALEQRKVEAEPTFLPVLLVASEVSDSDAIARIWEVADDVMHTPVQKAEFTARVENLLARRETATELTESRERLSEVISDLRIKERAMDAAPVGISISDPTQEDNPLVYVNEAYERLTGYDADEAIGRNARILQGEETAETTVQEMRDAIGDGRPVSVDVLNYRRDGSKFWNQVDVTPVTKDGEIVNYVGFQSDITDRKIREQRLEVLNRVLTHNLRNSLNVISGYAELLTAELDDEYLAGLADEVEAATMQLQQLSETVHRAEQSLPDIGTDVTPIEMDSVVTAAGGAVRERFTAATVRTDVQGDGCRVACNGITVAVKEVTANILEYNDREDPTVTLSLSTEPDPERAVLTIADDGPGIPEYEQEVIEDGMESPLKHSDGIGLWLVYWIVSSAGGELTFGEDGAVTISLPCYRGEQAD